MPRAHHPAAEAAAAAQYLSLLADPVYPLAEEVSRAVAKKVRDSRVHLLKAGKRSAVKAPVALDLTKFDADLLAVVARVLEKSLSAPTAEGKTLRMALIAKLAREEAGGGHVAAMPAHVVPSTNDSLLTTAEAAAKLEASRPYVSMLCDAGKLGEIILTEGRHRRVRASAVDTYLAARTKQHEGALSPREAGVAAGLYGREEGFYQNVVRETAGSTAKRTSARKSAAPRKPRS